MKRMAVAVAVAVALFGSDASVLAGDQPLPTADERASCEGKISSAQGPAATRDEGAHTTKRVAGDIGLPPGAIIGGVARLHEPFPGACS
jgi:hypothetical protein